MSARYSAIGICAVFAALLCARGALAAPVGIAVTPAVVELTLAPGAQHSGTVIIKNTSGSVRDISITTHAFDVAPNGATYLMPPLSDTQAPQLRVNVTRTMLASGEHVTLPYTVTVPRDARGVYALALAIRAQCAADDAPQAVGTCVQPRIGVPVIVTVPTGGADGGALTVHLRDVLRVRVAAATTVTVAVRNTLQHALRPRIHVSLRSLFGRVVAESDLKPQHLVLPDHERTFFFSLPHSFALGVYQLRVRAFGEGADAVQTYWIVRFAPQSIALTALVLLALLLWFVWHRKSLRKEG